MTKFVNGPAHGVTLMIRRVPLFLRVVMDPDGEFDALNELKDEPRMREQIYLYVYDEENLGGSVHLNVRGGTKKGGGFFPLAQYTYREIQPSDDILRERGKWEHWVHMHRSEVE